MIRNTMMKGGLITLSLMFLINFASKAQQGLSCSERLSIAEDSYEEGKLSNIATLLNKGDCFLKGGYTKEEKVRAYRLMALVSIFNDDEIGAEESVINLLGADPEHAATEDDPVELELLFEKYRSDPIFRVGLKVGANMTIANGISEYNTNSSLLGAQKDFNPKVGFVGELTGEYNIIDNLDVLLGFQFAFNSYEVTYHAVEQTEIDGVADTEFLIRLQEKMSSFKLPLMLRYHYDFKSISPYVLAGISGEKLSESKFEGERKGSTERATGNKLSLKDLGMRRTWNMSYLAGAGVKIRTNKVNFFTLEARYSMGAFNIVNGDNRYASTALNFDQAHIDEDKSLNSLSFSIGYLYSIYKPKKHSEKKLQKIFATKKKQRK